MHQVVNSQAAEMRKNNKQVQFPFLNSNNIEGTLYTSYLKGNERTLSVLLPSGLGDTRPCCDSNRQH